MEFIFLSLSILLNFMFQFEGKLVACVGVGRGR